MSWEVTFDESQGLMSVSGELTIFSIEDIRFRLLEAFKKVDDVRVDLGGIDEIDTAGLQLMLLAKRKPGRKVRFFNHSDEVLDLIRLANLGKTLGDPLGISAA